MPDNIITNLEFRQPRKETIEEVASSVYPGWHDLIKSMLDDLFELGWSGELRQIKEKFGTLRVYIITGGNEDLHARVMKAEEESSHVCRECGEPGKLRDDGWVEALCDTHAGK